MKTTKILSLLCLLTFVMLISCKDDDPETKTIPYLYFTLAYYDDDPALNVELIQKLSLDSLKITTVKDVEGMSGVGIAYDDKHDKIFFSDFFDADTPDGKIWKMNLDGTGPEAIATGILDPYGIALDVEGGKVYWTDDNGTISRSNLDGTNQDSSLVHVEEGGMRAIALDKANNKMYFYEVQNDNLYISNLDGTDERVLISGVYGYALFVDTKNHKLYFDDQYGPALKMANLDGTDVVEIDNTDTRIYGIAIDYDLNKLYWSGRDAGEIYMANLNGTEKVTLATELSSPRGLCLVK
jgi:DNA-binding beta-propeller fold protein YncE